MHCIALELDFAVVGLRGRHDEVGRSLWLVRDTTARIIYGARSEVGPLQIVAQFNSGRSGRALQHDVNWADDRERRRGREGHRHCQI